MLKASSRFCRYQTSLRAISLSILAIALSLAAMPAFAGCAGAKGDCGWPIRPSCCGSLKCELTAWPPECRHSPPLQDEACTIFSGCKAADQYCKGFQDGLAGRCTPYSRLGESCDGVFTLCGDGLKCRQDPRNLFFNDPETFGDGRCFADTPGQNVGEGLDWRNDDACLAVYSPSVHKALPKSELFFGETHAMAFGSGYAGQAGVAGSAERGGIYGDDGSFACYRQQCAGSGLVGLATFVAISEYKDFASGAIGEGVQVSAGVSGMLGWSHAVLWNLDPSNPEAIPVGEASALTFGAQAGPDAQMLVCWTDSNVVIENWRVMTGPAAACRNVEVCAAADSCTAHASIDAGSTARDGATPTLDQIPAGPYAIGEQQVTLQATDSSGAMDSCSATVDVNDCTPPALTCRPTVAECQSNRHARVEPLPPLVEDCSSYSIAGPTASDYPLGSTPVQFTVTDSYFNESSCGTEVRIVDTTAPEIRSIVATPDVLWPPNHKMQRVQVSVDSLDACDPKASCKITSVVSNEPDRANGDRSDQAGDIRVVGPLSVELRAERLGNGSGRTYAVSVECADTTGKNAASVKVVVRVPHNAGAQQANRK